jgi:hypothetical protein
MDKFMTVISNGIPFHVRLVKKDECYGANRCLTHNEEDPLVEFYDARYVRGFESLGQFVSRYYLSTLMERNQTYGLNLYGGVDDWGITEQEMGKVMNWLKWITNK